MPKLRTTGLTEERALRNVPPTVSVLLAAALAAQLIWHGLQPAPLARADALPPAPDPVTLRAVSLGTPVAAAQLLVLYLQAFAFYNVGNASAVVVVFFVIILALARPQLGSEHAAATTHGAAATVVEREYFQGTGATTASLSVTLLPASLGAGMGMRPTNGPTPRPTRNGRSPAPTKLHEVVASPITTCPSSVANSIVMLAKSSEGAFP